MRRKPNSPLRGRPINAKLYGSESDSSGLLCRFPLDVHIWISSRSPTYSRSPDVIHHMPNFMNAKISLFARVSRMIARKIINAENIEIIEFEECIFQ